METSDVRMNYVCCVWVPMKNGCCQCGFLYFYFTLAAVMCFFYFSVLLFLFFF